MPVMVVTRLRLRDKDQLDDFFKAAVAVLEQAKSSTGSLGSDVLAEANDTWWSITAWQDHGPMRDFVGAEPHLTTMTRLDDWCDEASFVDWEQASEQLPDWQTCYTRLVADGTSAELDLASPDNETRSFPAPVIPPPS